MTSNAFRAPVDQHLSFACKRRRIEQLPSGHHLLDWAVRQGPKREIYPPCVVPVARHSRGHHHFRIDQDLAPPKGSIRAELLDVGVIRASALPPSSPPRSARG